MQLLQAPKNATTWGLQKRNTAWNTNSSNLSSGGSGIPRFLMFPQTCLLCGAFPTGAASGNISDSNPATPPIYPRQRIDISADIEGD